MESSCSSAQKACVVYCGLGCFLPDLAGYLLRGAVQETSFRFSVGGPVSGNRWVTRERLSRHLPVIHMVAACLTSGPPLGGVASSFTFRYNPAGAVILPGGTGDAHKASAARHIRPGGCPHGCRSSQRAKRAVPSCGSHVDSPLRQPCEHHRSPLVGLSQRIESKRVRIDRATKSIRHELTQEGISLIV